MTCRSAGLFVFEVSGPLARIQLIPLLVPLPARSVLAASVVGLVIVGVVAALFVGPVDLVVG